MRTIRNSKHIKHCAILGLLTLLAGCGEEAVEEIAPVIRPAKLIEVTASADTRQINLPAIIEASASTDLTFQVGGLIQELPVIEGQEVTEGTVIARLDQRDFRNQLTTVQAQFDSAESEYQRAERLVAQNAIARNVLEQRKTQRDVAKATLDTARKALDDTTLRSPFDGIVAQKHAKAFQNIGPQEKVITLQTTGAAEAAVQVPARLVANSGRIEPTETIIVLDAAPDVQIPAVFKSSSTQADPDTQTFAVNFTFTPPEEVLILPGMTGTVQVTLKLAGADGGSEQLTVPLAAILTEGDDKFVWVVDKNAMTVSKRSVEVEGLGELLTVTAGLATGETIVGAGASYLHEGMQIRSYDQ